MKTAETTHGRDSHYNTHGHRLIADGLYNGLRRDGYLAPIGVGVVDPEQLTARWARWLYANARRSAFGEWSENDLTGRCSAHGGPDLIYGAAGRLTQLHHLDSQSDGF